MKFFKEFKKFIVKGNIFELAVAFIIGGAFKVIISSLVSDIIMPIVSLLIGKQGFANYKFVITPADTAAGIAENAIYWGRFVQNTVDFIIIGFVIFLVVYLFAKFKEKASRKKAIEEAVVAEQKPTVEDLLTDIKAILEKK